MNALKRKNHRTPGFSLVELVIVIVIIGIIAAIAIPRVSRGARGAGESALRQNLATLRNAIELYASEHNSRFPGTKADGSIDATDATFKDQMLKFSDVNGTTGDTRNAATGITLGPYLRKAIPVLPVGTGTNRGSSSVLIGDPLPAPTGATNGWIYNATNGEIAANTSDTEVDDAGKKYSEY